MLDLFKDLRALEVTASFNRAARISPLEDSYLVDRDSFIPVEQHIYPHTRTAFLQYNFALVGGEDPILPAEVVMALFPHPVISR